MPLQVALGSGPAKTNAEEGEACKESVSAGLSGAAASQLIASLNMATTNASDVADALLK